MFEWLLDQQWTPAALVLIVWVALRHFDPGEWPRALIFALVVGFAVGIARGQSKHEGRCEVLVAVDADPNAQVDLEAAGCERPETPPKPVAITITKGTPA